MIIPDGLPQLATGSHDRGSGKACIMNAISYLNGDARITDMPDCAAPVLAQMAIHLNDRICAHRRDRAILCSACSHEVWKVGARIIGTADALKGLSDKEVSLISVKLALFNARKVEHLAGAVSRPLNYATEAWINGTATIDEVKAARQAYAYVTVHGGAATFAAYAASYASQAGVAASNASRAVIAATEADAAYAAYAYAAAAYEADAYAYAYATSGDAAAFASQATTSSAAAAAGVAATAEAYAEATYGVAAYAASAAAYEAVDAAEAADAADGAVKEKVGRVQAGYVHASIDEFERLTGWSQKRQLCASDVDTVKLEAKIKVNTSA